MFLSQLTAEEKLAFDAIAHRLVMSDGTLAEQELAIVSQLHAEMGLAESPPSDGLPVEALTAHFASPRSRRIALLELLGIAHADGDFHSEESALLREVAQRFGVDEPEFKLLESWTLRMLSMVTEAQRLVDGEE